MYNCNGVLCVYFTFATAAGLHYTNIFRLTEIIDNYGHIMSVSMIYGFAISFGVYFITVATGTQIRMSGNFIYDVFMGACLNPRIGTLDLKMWAEVRIPWVTVFFLAVSGGCKQYEQYGYVTPVSHEPVILRDVLKARLQNMAFMILATWFYINAWYVILSPADQLYFICIYSVKGEECIPQTWDMFHEKCITFCDLQKMR
jgi:Delta24(24(1))-sterol reductase